jgi:hypothetical protein
MPARAIDAAGMPGWGCEDARGERIQQARQLLSLMMKTALNATVDSSANRNIARDRADLDLVRGEIALAEHKAAEAVKLFESARVVEPRVADILESLAFALVAADRLKDAPQHAPYRRGGRRVTSAS